MDNLYKIKPLAWVEWSASYGMWKAETPFGHYTVTKRQWSYYFDNNYDNGAFPCTSIKAGKAAAEAHWRERILPMLECVATYRFSNS